MIWLQHRRSALCLLILVMTLVVPGPTSAAFHRVEGRGGDGKLVDGPLKVFVLAGQSNMQGHAHVRTLDVMALDPVTAPILKQLVSEDGKPRAFDDIWVSSIGSAEEERIGQLTVGFGASGNGPKIGPELAFGVTMQELLGEPILIIKAAWGGKSLHTDFRPPSAGPYVFNETQLENFEKQSKDVDSIRAAKAEETGRYYRLMVEHVQGVLADIERVYPQYNSQLGYELAGMVWFQGWNDMVDGGVYPQRDKPNGYAAYSRVLADFIRDVRKDLSMPELPFIIGVLGVGGPVDKYGPEQERYKQVHQNFRDAMAAPALLPEFKGNVRVVLSENYWDMQAAALRKREQDLKASLQRIDERRKSGELDAQQTETARNELMAKAFTPDELHYLKNSTSNAEFHYLGSAKIMTQIGKAFAETLFESLQGR